MNPTSPTSRPSSPMHVATSTLSDPSRKRATIVCCSRCVRPLFVVAVVASSSPTGAVVVALWPMNGAARTLASQLDNRRTISATLSRHCVNTITFVVVLWLAIVDVVDVVVAVVVVEIVALLLFKVANDRRSAAKCSTTIARKRESFGFAATATCCWKKKLLFNHYFQKKKRIHNTNTQLPLLER